MEIEQNSTEFVLTIMEIEQEFHWICFDNYGAVTGCSVRVVIRVLFSAINIPCQAH